MWLAQVYARDNRNSYCLVMHSVSYNLLRIIQFHMVPVSQLFLT